MDVDLTFPPRFACTVRDELPGTPGPLLHFPPERATAQDGVIVEVSPDGGAPWIGMFAFGNAGATRVVAMPDGDQLCVVARGAGYVVSTSQPASWAIVRAVPILDVRAIAAAGVVVFADYTHLTAHGESGEAWRSPRISMDGFRIVAVGDHILVGEYDDQRTDSKQRFEVDLATGSTRMRDAP
jgi:hypothetical protein